MRPLATADQRHFMEDGLTLRRRAQMPSMYFVNGASPQAVRSMSSIGCNSADCVDILAALARAFGVSVGRGRRPIPVSGLLSTTMGCPRRAAAKASCPPADMACKD